MQDTLPVRPRRASLRTAPHGPGCLPVFGKRPGRHGAARPFTIDNKSEARFRALTELSSDWCWEQDEALRFRHISGLSGDRYVGKTAWQLGYTALDEAARAR